MLTLEQRIDRLEARAAISNLIGRYGLTVDDRDLEGLGDLFTPDGAFRSKDGVLNAQGRAAVMEQYRGRFAALGPCNHFTHDHVIDFDEGDPDRATGIVTSHAEVWRNGQAMLTALRYNDQYRRGADGKWRFADRLLTFFYYLPVTEYAQALGDPLRQRAYGDRRPADYPEPLPSWRLYHQSGESAA
ncbi:nuclear transport factor 2 family protein [Niveispirillum sp. KHB5.9]|uniref:nuclear transport factor 2 family protein n=1 Tax=Niveispirillum sp. KHB5.9 TaxID=3400269 RepID=UPI003A8ACB47